MLVEPKFTEGQPHRPPFIFFLSSFISFQCCFVCFWSLWVVLLCSPSAWFQVTPGLVLVASA